MIALLFVVVLASAQDSPLLCQRVQGGIVYKIPDVVCKPKSEGESWYGQVYVPEIRERKDEGTITTLWTHICETHYFFWGSYTTNTATVHRKIVNIDDVSMGGCPSDEHPTPYVNPPHIKCSYTWPGQRLDSVDYCIRRPATVIEKATGEVYVDGSHVIGASLADGRGLTVDGAYVTWQRETPRPKYALRDEGVLYCKDKWCTAEGLQESYDVGKISVGNHTTTTGYIVNLIQRYPIREKRDTTDIDSVRKELLTKMQYMELDITDRLSSSERCADWDMYTRLMWAMSKTNPTLYMQMYLNRTDITAHITGSLIYVWPCVVVDEWRVVPVNISGTCSTRPKITYTYRGTSGIGYLDPNTRIISNDTDQGPCAHLPPQHLYGNTVWDPSEGVEERVNPIVLRVDTAKEIPSWKDEWLYHVDDYAHDTTVYATQAEVRELIEEERLSAYKDESRTWMQTGFPYPYTGIVGSALSILRLVATGGGLCYIWDKTFSRRLTTGAAPLLSQVRGYEL